MNNLLKNMFTYNFVMGRLIIKFDNKNKFKWIESWCKAKYKSKKAMHLPENHTHAHTHAHKLHMAV